MNPFTDTLTYRLVHVRLRYSDSDNIRLEHLVSLPHTSKSRTEEINKLLMFMEKLRAASINEEDEAVLEGYDTLTQKAVKATATFADLYLLLLDMNSIVKRKAQEQRDRTAYADALELMRSRLKDQDDRAQ